MKKQLLTITLSLFTAASAFAGGNHFHPKQMVKCEADKCTETQIKEALPKAITYLADWKKIDSAWAKAKIESIGQKEFKKGPEWVVTLKNEANEVRYVFFTLDGYVAGSNTTGN